MQFRIRIFHVFIPLLLIIFSSASFAAVTVLADVEPKSVEIGDRINYVVTIEADAGESIKPLVRLGNHGPFEVADVKVSGEEPKFTITFVLAPFETGKLKLPDYEFEWSADGGEIKKVKANDVYIDVASLITGEEGEPDPDVIASVMEPKRNWKVYIIPLLLVLAGIAALYFLYTKWMARRKEELENRNKLTPFERVVKELERIKVENRYAKGDIKGHFSSVSDAVRLYMEEEYGVLSMEYTTWELSRNFPPEISGYREMIIGMLEVCDGAKFAKEDPGEKAAIDVVESGLQFARETVKRGMEEPADEVKRLFDENANK